MALSFTEAKNTLDLVAGRTVRNQEAVDRAKAELLAAQTNLGQMPSDYQGLAGEIDAAALANPADDAWLVLKAEKDLMVSDFQALKAEVDALLAAIGL